MKRKILIILFGSTFLILVFLMYLIFTQQREQSNVVQTPILTRDINLPNPIGGQVPVGIVDTPEVKTEIPSEMSLLEFQFKNLEKSSIDTLAKNLNFTGDPYEIKDIREGTKYVWSSEEYYLWTTPSKANIRYGMNQLPVSTTNSNLTGDEIRNLAINFVSNKFNIDAEVLDVASVIPYRISGQGEAGLVTASMDNAQVYQVNFYYKDAGHIIFTTIPSHPTVFAQILTDGTIYKAEAYVFDQINPSDEKYPILSSDEIKNNLTEAKLNAFLNDYISVSNVDVEDIRFIEITSVTLGYFFNQIEVSSPLQPVYLLEGKTKIDGYQADFAQLYLPAIDPASR
jgi:hypothetical protein